jgi:Rrf2 family iron-sulfur cluster assembly transcriptional regulator
MISRSSEYAIRALTFLAKQGGQRFHLARDMAEALGIPAPFLGKVLQPLVTRGVLDSQRGRSGGFKLARASGEITLLHIVETQENLDHLHHCILGQAECTDERPCPLHDYWKATSRDFLHMLTGTTLQDLVDHASKHPQSAYPFPSSTNPLMTLSNAKRSEPHEEPAPRAACF